MRVWIDMSNSPHPLLFAPIERELTERGADVRITVRDHAQTLELTRERWPDAVVLGTPPGPGRAGKVAGMAARVGACARWAAREKPDVALSHNSYAQILAARITGVPVVTAMDYEHQPVNHMAFRAARTVLLPEALPPASVRRQGASPRKVIRYPGLKEELYLGDFSPDDNVLEALGVRRGAGTAVVVARSAAAGATYHPDRESPVRAGPRGACRPGARPLCGARPPRPSTRRDRELEPSRHSHPAPRRRRPLAALRGRPVPRRRRDDEP